MTFVLGMLVLMNNFSLNSFDQHDIFKVQFRQMLSRAKIIECEDLFIISKNNKKFEISLNGNRIVKTPGFEILLYDVDTLFTYPVADSCIIEYIHKGKEEEIEIRYQH